MGKTLKRIQEEIEKCDVVCATCHRIRTWNRLPQNAPLVQLAEQQTLNLRVTGSSPVWSTMGTAVQGQSQMVSFAGVRPEDEPVVFSG